MNINTNFLLWALLLFCCPDPGWTTQAQELASLEVKMTNIVDRMTRMEAEMVTKDEMMEVRDRRITVLEDAMETRDQRIAMLEATVETLEGALETRDTKTCQLQKGDEEPDRTYHCD